MTLRFAIIGVGYVAPRHMKAIKDIGGELCAVLDPHDSVGILDSYFPNCLYFREVERFERWLYKYGVDYVSVCSPNYLHDSHCMMAMRCGADVICEKPVTLNVRNLYSLAELESKTGQKVNVVLQSRLHPEAVKAKQTYTGMDHKVHIDYITPRGKWYDYSWKGDAAKSGGVTTNIGIHLFDLCAWMFGRDVHITKEKIFFESAEVTWNLSTKGDKPKRVFEIDGNLIDITNGFNDLHTELYWKVVSGEGFGLEDILTATRIIERLRGQNG